MQKCDDQRDPNPAYQLHKCYIMQHTPYAKSNADLAQSGMCKSKFPSTQSLRLFLAVDLWLDCILLCGSCCPHGLLSICVTPESVLSVSHFLALTCVWLLSKHCEVCKPCIQPYRHSSCLNGPLLTSFADSITGTPTTPHMA